MAAWKDGMVDMELDDESKIDAIQPIPMPNKPDYPYGLRIALTDKEIGKLKLQADCDVGDEIEFRARGVVTSVNKSDDNCRVEIQIQAMAVEDA